MTTAFFTDPSFSIHTQAGHPEHAGRLESIIARYEATGLVDRLARVDAEPVSNDQIAAVHEPEMIALLESLKDMKRMVMLGLDTYATPQSFELARLAAGGVCAVVDAVLSGEAENGLAAVRPPGHHATPSQPMGFCLINNIAIAARHARQERVAIIDFDVHHGNGTQDIFYDDDKVLFISSHQSPLYPGTGSLPEVGVGAGRGYTVNIPLPPQTGDAAFPILMEQVIEPLVKRYDPQLLLISGGFDGHWADPLAHHNISLTGYADLCRRLVALAAVVCGGKIVFVTEGGYDLRVLAHAWENIAYALLNEDTINDPLGESPSGQHKLSDDLLRRILDTNNLVT